MYIKEVIVLGVPIAKKRPRFFRRGKGVGTYNCQDTEEGRFMWGLKNAIGNDRMFPVEGKAITIHVLFSMPIPSSLSKRKQTELLNSDHIKKPDLDNLLKFLKDCANGILWRDDALVSRIIAVKKYDFIPATKVIISFDEG